MDAGEFAPLWAALFMSQTKHEDFAKREAIPEPTWDDFFLPGQHSAFIRILGLDSERAMAYLRAAYLWPWNAIFGQSNARRAPGWRSVGVNSNRSAIKLTNCEKPC